MVEFALLHVEILRNHLWLPPKSLSPLCVADESVQENILGTCVGWRILIIGFLS